MTNAEFEQRYPEIAEGENDLNEHSAKKAAKSKTLKRTSGWTKESFEELKEEMQLDSDEAEEIDDSSSYRVWAIRCASKSQAGLHIIKCPLIKIKYTKWESLIDCSQPELYQR